MVKIEISIHSHWELGAAGMRYQAFYDATAGLIDEETVKQKDKDYMTKYAIIKLKYLSELFKKLAVKMLNESYKVDLTGDEVEIIYKEAGD